MKTYEGGLSIFRVRFSFLTAQELGRTFALIPRRFPGEKSISRPLIRGWQWNRFGAKQTGDHVTLNASECAPVKKNMTNQCKVCGKQDAKKCGKCRRVFYCSVQCQRKDWKYHKGVCNSGLQTQLSTTGSTPSNNDSDKTSAKAVSLFCQPFTLEKFIPHVEKIKDNTKRCATGWVGLRLAGMMDIDSSLATCFVFYTSEGHVREHMICMEAPPPVEILQKCIDQFQAHAVSMSVEIRYRNPHTMVVVKEGVLLQIIAKGYDKKFFFDQTRGGRSKNGVLLCVTDPEECHIPLFDAARIQFH